VAARRGTVERKARADGAGPSSVVFIPFCYAEAAANTLANPALDPLGKGPDFKPCVAPVDRVEVVEAVADSRYAD